MLIVLMIICFHYSCSAKYSSSAQAPTFVFLSIDLHISMTPRRGDVPPLPNLRRSLTAWFASDIQVDPTLSTCWTLVFLIRTGCFHLWWVPCRIIVIVGNLEL
jgi:hypothetical protein